MDFKLFISGSTQYADPYIMEKRVSEFMNMIARMHFGKDVISLFTGTPGAESMGADLAKKKGWQCLTLSSGNLYHRMGNAIENANAAIFFYEQLDGSTHAINLARAAQIPYAVVASDAMTVFNLQA